MHRIGFVLLSCLLLACKGKKESSGSNAEKGFEYDSLAALFTEVAAPYSLSDTALQKSSGATIIPQNLVASFISDSVKAGFFSKKEKLKYQALASLRQKGKESYFIVKASGMAHNGAFILVFDKEHRFGAASSFLLPDKDPSTFQTTVMDKSFAISKNIVQKTGGDVTGEGKEVLAYDAAEKKFSLIMTDLLNDNPAVLVNPIDTFKRTNKFAGDYYLNKNNLVAVRDGRRTNELLIYVHTQNAGGDCKGELKGEALITSGSTAAYRSGGDPCVLGLSFAGNTVTLREESGCGNHRDLDCPLSGSFTRKKEQKAPASTKKKKAK